MTIARRSVWKPGERDAQRTLVQAYDGRETSVAVIGGTQYSFLTNGKSDGSAVGDAGTQVMLGIAGAILHPNRKNACVVGLGTGTTAGWLADVPGMQRVDVLELEEEIRKVAEFFDPVSRNAMKHPRVNNITGDAREFLLTKGRKLRSHRLRAVESLPCRRGQSLHAGVLHATRASASPRTAFSASGCKATRSSPTPSPPSSARCARCFPRSRSGPRRVSICCSSAPTMTRPGRSPPSASASKLSRWRKRCAGSGKRTRPRDSSGCLANSDYCSALAASTKTVNTDDMNRLEFSFARSVAKQANCSFDSRPCRHACRLLSAEGGCRYGHEIFTSPSACIVPGRLWESASADVLPSGVAPADSRTGGTAKEIVLEAALC
jgi:hypothetical protein